MAESRLHELSEQGQSVWIDSVSRTWLQDGTMHRLMEEDAVVGVTSNPTIFQKALAEGDAYDDQLRELLQTEDDPREIFFNLAVRDIQDACDLFRGGLGRHRRARRLRLARGRSRPRVRHRRRRSSRPQRFHDWVDKPNLYVKIPATKAGLPAIEEMIARGKSINVTLIFSLRALPRGRRGVHPRPRALRRGRRRPVDGHLGGELLRLARGHRGGQAARARSAARRSSCAASSRSRTRSSRTRHYGEIFSGERWERSRRRARGRSAASGRPRRRRTRTTATSCTSRS